MTAPSFGWRRHDHGAVLVWLARPRARSQHALRRRDVAPLDPHGVAQRAGHALEGGLDEVVRMDAGPGGDVEGDAGGGREGAPEVLGQAGIEGWLPQPD